VIRDVQHNAGGITCTLNTRIETGQRLYAQQRNSKEKLHPRQRHRVECIVKGRATTPYEFGLKISAAVTSEEDAMIGMRSIPGSPYDDHKPNSQFEQLEILAGAQPSFDGRRPIGAIAAYKPPAAGGCRAAAPGDCRLH
jgi:IS5 family transposase